MLPSSTARELSILLRISRELDIVGDITATIDNPSELLAWARILDDPEIVAWRADDSGHRYVQVTAHHSRAPIRGQVAAVLQAERHRDFWTALDLEALPAGGRARLSIEDLADAWTEMPIAPPDLDSA